MTISKSWCIIGTGFFYPSILWYYNEQLYLHIHQPHFDSKKKQASSYLPLGK